MLVQQLFEYSDNLRQPTDDMLTDCNAPIAKRLLVVYNQTTSKETNYYKDDRQCTRLNS